MAKKQKYRALVAVYNDANEVIAGVGEITDALSPNAAAWLLEQGLIEEVK